MHPENFRNVLAPGLLAHQKSFHLGVVHYHFTPIGGMVVLVALIALAAFGLARWLFGRS